MKSNREVIVVTKDVPALPGAAGTLSGASSKLASILAAHAASMVPLFPVPASPPNAMAAGEMTPELAAIHAEQSRYHRVQVPDEQAENLVAELKQSDAVETAYIKPATENPLGPPERLEHLLAAAPAVNIPDFTARQPYLDTAPGGIDAKFAWTLTGGKGVDVRIIDVEGSWQFSHLDLLQNLGGLIGGTPYNDVAWRNHGTAVIGEIGADENAFGTVGIAPLANVAGVSHGGLGSAGAIQLAALRLRPGDILLLEMHRPGPKYNYQDRVDQLGYIAVEWWPDDYLAIAAATARGVIVVEAAGNGAEDLDANVYDMPGPGFPPTWRNPFRGAGRDSGAIVVGAGAPPSGAFGPGRSRLDFSNYGSRIDCQGWGRGVVTTGYGDLFQLPTAPADENYWYTSTFSGTSSASPIVTGAIACLQGARKAQGAPISPRRARNLLRATGSPQQASPTAPLTQRIGNRPDLRQLIAHAQSTA
jgi:subtilisin family serine protease